MVEDTDHRGLESLPGPRLSRRRIILAASTLALARFIGAGVDVARADRFGPPWMARIVGYNVLVFQQADGVSAAVAKYRFDRMTSRSVPSATHAYDLPNVPFTEYFRVDGSAIHGTYWHDAFENAQSQGRINLTWTDSAYVFDQTFPAVPPDQPGVQVDGAQATPVLIVN